MSQVLSACVPGNLGTAAGSGSDGVLVGALTPTNPTKALLRSLAQPPLCYLDDGGLYTLRDTEIQEATGDDVAALPATPAVDDATYLGHATLTFARVDVNITTQGAGTWTVTWEYWDGSAWTALSGVTDGTTGFTAATGWKSVTFTLPEDWAKCTVDGVNAYWVRGRVSAYTSVTTQPLLGQGYVIVTTADATWTDDTTDFTDAGAGDVALLPAYPMVGDGIFLTYTEKFCKVKVTTSQARTGTATLTWKYWNGTAWSSLTVVNDDSVGWSATAGTLLVHFEPPSDWVACTAGNGPNGQTGFAVCCELTAMTDVTQQPLATQGWVLPLVTGATGMRASNSGTIVAASFNGLTVSGSTADSLFLVVNVTTGATAKGTWTKAIACDVDTISLAVSAGHQLAIVQIQEDATTEFADANFSLST